VALKKHTYRLKDGSQKETIDWYYRFSYRGKIYFGSTKTSNKTLAAKIEKKKYEDALTKFELGITESITLKNAIENFLGSVSHSSEYHNTVTYTEKMLGSKKDNRCTAVETKYLKIYGFDGDRLFESIKTADIQHLVLNRRKEGNKNGTILAELSTFSLMTKLNKKLGYPTPIIDLAAIKKDNNIKPHKGKLRYLSKDEETRLLEQLHPDTIVNGVTGSPIESIVQNRQDIYDLVVICRISRDWTHLISSEWDHPISG
jgi:hypothetical protein